MIDNQPRDPEEEFLESIRQYIRYWMKQDRDELGKMEGLAFSILCLLDGVSGDFRGIGEISGIDEDNNVISAIKGRGMLHDRLWKKE